MKNIFLDDSDGYDLDYDVLSALVARKLARARKVMVPSQPAQVPDGQRSENENITYRYTRQFAPSKPPVHTRRKVTVS